MRNMLKELRPFIPIILVVIVLLFFQAMTDLALPDYMSRMVNVGIQQNGIENAVPEVIRADTLRKIKLFLTEQEKEILDRNYRLISRENLPSDEYQNLQKKYPALADESLYLLSQTDQDDLEIINDFLGEAVLVVSGIERFSMAKGNDTLDMPLPENDFLDSFPPGVDPFMVLENLPAENSAAIIARIKQEFSTVSKSMITQSAAAFIKQEYQIIGVNIEKVQTNYILVIGGIMLGIALLGVIASISVGFLSARISAALGRNLRRKIFKKVTAFSSAEFERFSTASLITRSTNDVQQVQMFLIMLLRTVFYAPILGVGGVLRALNTNTSMAWIIGVGVLSILTLVIILFSIATPKFRKVQKLIDKVNLVMREALNGLMVIRAFNNQEYEEKKFDEANKDLTRTNLFVSRLMVLMMPLMMLIMNGITLLIIWIGAHEVDKGVIQVGDMMAFMQYTMQIIMSFLMISMISIVLPRASVSIRRISEVLDQEITITDPISVKQLPSYSPGKIEFRNVSFKYPTAEECVLKNISFTAQPGKTTAFIGGIGSGKSTLINLIPRFYDVTEGEILVDGVNIKELSLNELRNRIGYVPQRGFLFMGTIESNLKYGKNHDAADEAVEKAINIAQAKEFIAEKEEGILTEIAQGGANVSGGQKQRLSMARALVKEPEVLIFDDSFSALDFKTDAALRKAINREIKNRTIFIVAQRINTIIHADQIVVLDNGRIAGIGTHKELLDECDVYKEIALSQLSEEELAI